MSAANTPRWPDGTAKSTANAFSSWKDGRRSIFLGAAGFTGGKTGPKTEAQLMAPKFAGTFARAKAGAA